MNFNEILRQNIDNLAIIEDYRYSMIIGSKKGKYRILVKEGEDIKYNACLNKESRLISQSLSCFNYYKSMGVKVKILDSVKYIFENNVELSKIKDTSRTIRF